MFKKYLFVALAYLLSISGFSQSKNTGNIYNFEEKRFFGSIEANGVASQVDGDFYGGYNKVGLSAGAKVAIQFQPLWLMEMGLFYTQKGSRIGKETTTDLGMTIDKYKLNINCVDVPFSINYIYQQTYYFGLGLSYNAFLGAKESMENYNGTITYEGPEYKFNRHGAEWFLNVVAMANKNLKFQIQYHYSILPIRMPKYAPSGSAQFNNYFTFGMAYVF
jgi:hypothetical protein